MISETFACEPAETASTQTRGSVRGEHGNRREAQRHHHRLARTGYAARATVYLLVGGLTTPAALGQGGQASGSHDALHSLLRAPLGDVLLLTIAAGLIAFASWRSIQAVRDPDRHGTDAKGVVTRVALGVSAVTYLLLASFTVSLVFTLGNEAGSSGDNSRGIVAWLMQKPYGPTAVGLIGCAIIGAGVAHAIKGWKTDFAKYLQIPASTSEWAYPVCRFGLIIRGVVLMIVGGFFVLAAYQVDPSEAGGMAEVFATVRRQEYGNLLLAIVAVGLAAFGIYGLIEAIYRRIEMPGLENSPPYYSEGVVVPT